jgi:hypothetical protein
MALKFKKQVQATVTKETLHKGKVLSEATETQMVETPTKLEFSAPMAVVTVEGSRTVNLGDFNSARFGVSLALPCSVDDIEETYTYGATWVEGKIEEAIGEDG